TDRQNRRPQTEPYYPCTRTLEWSYTPVAAGSPRGDDMRLMGGGPYRCALCGAVLILPFDATPKVKIAAASGRPTWRILSIGNCQRRSNVDPLATCGFHHLSQHPC